MNPRSANPSQSREWMVRLIQPVHPNELNPEERFAYSHFLYRARNLVIIKAVLNALLVVLFLFTVMPDAPGTVLIALADGLLLIPYYFLARRWPALSTIGLLSLTAVAISAADAASGYQTFTSGVFYAALIVAGAVLLLHPRNVAIVTASVTAIFVATYLLEMTRVVPVEMTLLTPRAILRVMTLHTLSFLGLGALSGVLAQLYRQLLVTRSQRDIQLALQEGFRDITADNVGLPTVLQRIAERAVAVLPTADRALLMVQEGEVLVVRGAAGHPAPQPIGQTVPVELFERYLHGSPMVASDLPERLRTVPLPETLSWMHATPPSQSTFVYPLKILERRHILLVVSNIHNATAFDEAERGIIDLFAHQAAVAIENAHLLADAQERLQSEIALSRIGQEIASHLRMPELVPAIYRHIAQVMDAPSFLIATKHPQGNDLYLLSSIDFGQVVPAQVIPAQGVLGWVMRNRRTLRLGDAQQEIAAFPEIRIQPLGEASFVPGSLLAVPLLVGNQVVGALSVQSPDPHRYNERDENLLANLANYIAVAVQNARLYDEVQRKQDELQGLITAVAQRLQGPVEALIGFGRLLKEDGAPSMVGVQREYLERLERNSYWIAQLAQDMLFLARLGQVQEIEPIALGTLVRGVVTHLELEQQGIGVTIQPDMLTLYADPVLLWAYFHNVLQNACRLGQDIPSPEIRVGWALVPEGYQLSVQTNGRALTPEQLQHAYELFFAIGEPEGVSLSLATARRIAEHYGGRVWAAAAVEGGTIFNLILPQALGENREDS